MKKHIFYWATLLLSSVLLFSCEEDSDPSAITITSAIFDANNSLTVVQSADTLDLSFTVSTEDRIESITVVSGSQSTPITGGQGEKEYNFTLNVAQNTAGTFQFTIEARTMDGGFAEETYTLTIEEAEIAVQLTRAGAVIEDSKFSSGTNSYELNASLNELIRLEITASAGLESVTINSEPQELQEPFDDDFELTLGTTTPGTKAFLVNVVDKVGVTVTVNYTINVPGE